MQPHATAARSRVRHTPCGPNGPNAATKANINESRERRSIEITVCELKNRWSEYLRRVANGEEMIVTSRGKVTALMLPPRRRAAAARDAAIARFRSLPWVRPGSGEKPALPKPLPRIGTRDKTLAQIVREQRH